MRRLLATVSLIALLAGCAAVRDPGRGGGGARMAQPASVAGVAEESFGKPAWGRQGEFTLHGQKVRYERGAERLALFEALPPGVATPLRFTWTGPSGDSAAVCEGWTPAASAAARSAATRPWVLSCRWGSAPAAMLQIGEGQLRGGLLTREGAYRRGELTVGLRSAHALEGGGRPEANAVGYEMLYQGTVVASLDLSGPQPRLRRPDPATPLGRAVTEAALALALASER
jgi:hypothetical protein